MENKLLKIYVHLTEINEINMEKLTIRMMLFDGYCEGPYFQGTILPGGVDTQTIYSDGTGHLSARYMLKGTDNTNHDCCIYIENTAVIGSKWTKPRIFTDSENLKWIEQASLKGSIENENGKLVINIFSAV